MNKMVNTYISDKATSNVALSFCKFIKLIGCGVICMLPILTSIARAQENFLLPEFDKTDITNDMNVVKNCKHYQNNMIEQNRYAIIVPNLRKSTYSVVGSGKFYDNVGNLLRYVSNCIPQIYDAKNPEILFSLRGFFDVIEPSSRAPLARPQENLSRFAWEDPREIILKEFSFVVRFDGNNKTFFKCKVFSVENIFIIELDVQSLTQGAIATGGYKRSSYPPYFYDDASLLEYVLYNSAYPMHICALNGLPIYRNIGKDLVIGKAGQLR